MKSNVNTKSILSEVNKVLAISDSYQAPGRVLELVLNTDRVERDRVYSQLASLFDEDYSRDWFWEYFQEEHADRHKNKQDFTPSCIASVISRLLRAGRQIGHSHITYEPAAGTGQMIIHDWWLTRKRQMPWEYRPSDHLYICAEQSVKTIPFLLLNMAVRGMCGIVFRMDTMTKVVYDTYVLCNAHNSPIEFSDVEQIHDRYNDQLINFL